MLHARSGRRRILVPARSRRDAFARDDDVRRLERAFVSALERRGRPEGSETDGNRI
jgi:hypothetical protein